MSKAKNGQNKGFHGKKQDNEINSPDTKDIATNDSKDIFTSSQNNTAKDTWQEVKLGEVVEINAKSIDKNYKHQTIIYLDTGSITNNQVSTLQNFEINQAPSRAKRLVKQNDVIYSLVRPIQRHFGFINKPQDNLVVSTGFCVISSNENYLNSKYLYYFLSLNETTEFLDSIAEGSTTCYPSLKPSDIENLTIKLPPLETQRKIAQILSSLDDKIDLLHKQNQSLESLAQTLFEYHFIHNAKAEWEEKPLSEIAEIGIGRTPPRKEKQYFSTNNQDMQWISIKDMGDNGIFILNTAEYLTHEAVEKFNIPIIPKNSVLLSFKMTLGRVAITSCDMLSNEAIAHFKLKQDSIITKEYLYLFLKTFRYETLGSTSSIVTAINSTMIKALLIKIPNVNEIKEFQTKTENLFSKIYQNSKQIESLKSLRDIMLPKLLNGEIGVKDE